MDGYEVRRLSARRVPMVDVGPSPRVESDLDEGAARILLAVFEEYGHMGNAEIKTAVYRTAPMQHILRVERDGRDMRNKPVLYKDKTASELDRPSQ